MSITDNHTVYPDSLGDNILSNILLTSDLKGYIENPGYYFNGPYTPAVQRHLDLVMLSPRWRRFRNRKPDPDTAIRSEILYRSRTGRIRTGEKRSAREPPTPRSSPIRPTVL